MRETRNKNTDRRVSIGSSRLPHSIKEKIGEISGKVWKNFPLPLRPSLTSQMFLSPDFNWYGLGKDLQEIDAMSFYVTKPNRSLLILRHLFLWDVWIEKPEINAGEKKTSFVPMTNSP